MKFIMPKPCMKRRPLSRQRCLSFFVDLIDGHLRCQECGIDRGLLSDKVKTFIVAVEKQFGPIDHPIILRELPKQRSTASAAAWDLLKTL
jgi:hypothetical protein